MRETCAFLLDRITQRGASYAEIRAQKNKNTILSLKDGLVEAVTLADETGAGIRVLAIICKTETLVMSPLINTGRGPATIESLSGKNSLLRLTQSRNPQRVPFVEKAERSLRHRDKGGKHHRRHGTDQK